MLKDKHPCKTRVHAPLAPFVIHKYQQGTVAHYSCPTKVLHMRQSHNVLQNKILTCQFYNNLENNRENSIIGCGSILEYIPVSTLDSEGCSGAKDWTWNMFIHAPIEPTICGTGRFIISKSLNESDLISTKLFCKMKLPL